MFKLNGVSNGRGLITDCVPRIWHLQTHEGAGKSGVQVSEPLGVKDARLSF